MLYVKLKLLKRTVCDILIINFLGSQWGYCGPDADHCKSKMIIYNSFVETYALINFQAAVQLVLITDLKIKRLVSYLSKRND